MAKKRKKIKGDKCRVVVTYDMGDQLMHEVLYADGRAHIVTHADGRGSVHLVKGRSEGGKRVNFVTYGKVYRIARYPR